MKQQADYRKLAELLQLAYSAEMGAALVYRGHRRSISDERERGGIRRI
jgi:hypothetical protein